MVNLAIYHKYYTIIIISAAAFNAAKGRCSKNEKLVFSVLAVLITVLILAGCEKAPAPATDPVPTPQESLSSEESQSSSVYVKEPQATVF